MSIRSLAAMPRDHSGSALLQHLRPGTAASKRTAASRHTPAFLLLLPAATQSCLMASPGSHSLCVSARVVQLLLRLQGPARGSSPHPDRRPTSTVAQKKTVENTPRMRGGGANATQSAKAIKSPNVARRNRNGKHPTAAPTNGPKTNGTIGIQRHDRQITLTAMETI